MGVNCLCLLKEILLQTNIAAKLSHHGISHNTISMHAFDARLAGYHKLFSLKLNIYISTKFFVGLCLARLRSYLLAGSQVVVQGALLCGKWLLFVLCGLFVGSEMIDVLGTLQSLARSSSFFFSFLPFSPGQRAGLPRG
jgi:hypothetical protein